MLFGLFFFFLFLVGLEYHYEGESTYESNGGNLTKASMVFPGVLHRMK